MRSLILTASIVALSIGSANTSLAQAPSDTRSQPIPEWVITEWDQLIGIWITDNQAYKSDTDSMDAYGIEWSWGIGKKSLTGRLYGIKEGREVGTFWEFREFWHPGEGQRIATQFGSDGTYGAGPHGRKPDGTNEMLQTFYDPTTGGVTRIGHRSELKGDLHTTYSFDVSEEGVWKERRTYIWHRKR